MSFLLNLLFKKQRTLLAKVLKGSCWVVVLVLCGIYSGELLFGKRGYEVLRKLQIEQKELYSDINRLKEENSKLQKTLLEKKYLDPDLR